VDLLTVDVGAGIDTYDFEQDLPVHNITQATDHATIQLGIDNATTGDVLTHIPQQKCEKKPIMTYPQKHGYESNRI
jgi:hypothetical protein